MPIAMETGQPPKLLQHSDNVLPQAVHPHLIACCPTMDLVAFVTLEEHVHVYRFGGQRVFAYSKKENFGKVVGLGWKFNGQYLAVSWANGITELLSSELGKRVKHFQQHDGSSANHLDSAKNDVSCIGWGLNFIDVASVRRKTSSSDAKKSRSSNPFEGLTSDNWGEKPSASTIDDFLERIPDATKVEIPLDLPDQLANIDITNHLVRPPSLPMLPPAAYKGGAHEAAELFSSQVSLDAALGANDSHSVNGLEALMLAQDNVGLRLILYDVLQLGSLTLPAEWRLQKYQFRNCAFHPYSCTYMFLIEFEREAGKKKTALLPVSLRFARTSGNLLHIIASKTAQLQILTEYINECLWQIDQHWTEAKKMPSRFIDIINEDLEKENQPNLVQCLFHLAATGDCPSMLKEWLVDVLAERGHKRWDGAIMHGYTKVRELTHTSLLPAVDRCVALLTHLRGLAIYHEHSQIINVPVSLFDGTFHIIRCIRLLAHHVLLYYSEETQQWATFSKWLRRQIDIQAAQNPPNPGDEDEHAIDIDYSLLFTYLQGALQRSKLDPFVHSEAATAQLYVSASMYDDCKKALTSWKAGEQISEELINLSAYGHEWSKMHVALSNSITSHQKGAVQISDGVVLEAGEVLLSELAMLESHAVDANKAADGHIDTIAATVHKDTPYQVNLCLVTHVADYSGAESVRTTTSSIIRLPSHRKILSLRVIDSGLLMLLVRDKDSSHILALPLFDSPSPLQTSAENSVAKNLIPDGQALQAGKAVNEMSAQDMERYTKHTFGPNDRLKPARIEINARKNRRAVVVLGEDGRQMRVLDLDYKAGDEIVDPLGKDLEADDGDDEMIDG